ncbi:hypothetical protein F4859DRAFT_512957 [Xylaria cf. heliscus]|nr:hypothetical protein F4859DRAFT_512957 [Xylaria cf. heliscus]
MPDTTPDCDFDYSDIKQMPPEGTFDDAFADVNFNEDFDDPEFEARLAEDYPVKEEPAPTSPPHLEPPIFFKSDPQLSDELSSQQQQFVNPQELFNDSQTTFVSPDLINGNGLNFDWPLGQGNLDTMLAQDLGAMLTQDPIFTQPLDTQVYSNYFPMENQVFSQPIIYEQPIVNQINGQQMLYQPPIDLGYQVSWPVEPEPIPEPIIIPQIIPQGMLQPNFQTMPQLMPQSILPSIPQPSIPQTLMQQPVTQQLLMPQPRPPGTLPPTRRPKPAEMPPPPLPHHQPEPQLIPGRPIPTAPKPEEGYKPVNPAADSFIPVQLRSSRNSRELPSAGTKTTSPPLKRPAKNHNGEPLLNDRIPRRTHLNKGPDLVEPERYYGPSPPKPPDWGPRDARGRYLFTYTEKGELAAGLFLTAREMRMYLMGPSPLDTANFAGPYRLPGVKLRTKKKRQGLTLWVGWPAAMSNVRYPRGGESTKCRFKNCPYRQRTIALGDPWVILDERQNADGEAIDPFHNAGYLHLFCLESNFDIVDLWQCLDIRPDYRSFKRESHPYFCLAYKLSGIDTVVKDWWFNAFRDWEIARSHGMKRIRTHASSLAQCLVNHKLENEPRAQMKTREQRGGADISKHRGDPETKLRLVEYRKHGLLENGWPVQDAEAKLFEIYDAKRRKRANRYDSFDVNEDYLSSPLPVFDYGQQLHYPVQPVGMGPVNTMQPIYNMEPVYPTANPVYLDQPIQADPYIIHAPNAPVAVTGKRTWDEAGLEDVTALQMSNQVIGEPSMALNPEQVLIKRRRLDDVAPAYQPATETLPTLTQTSLPAPSVPAGQAETGTQDWQEGYYLENDTSGIWDPLLDYRADIDPDDLNRDLRDDDLDAFFGDPAAEETVLDNGKLDSNRAGHVGSETIKAEPAPAEPAPAELTPAPPHEASANQLDSDSDSLFGKPGSSPSGSPKAVGYLSPLKTETPYDAHEIKTEK